MNIAGGSIYSTVVSSHNDLTDIGVNNHPTIDNFINSKAQANGIAPLDSSSKVPLTHLPTSSNIFKGLWNANTNTPQLLTGGVGGITGDYYIVNIAGNTLIDGINTWDVGDWIIHTGTKWERIDNPDPELVDLGTEYKTLKDQPIKNNTTPTDPKHLVQKDYVDNITIDHNNLLNKGTLPHVDLDAHVLDDSKHRLINDLGNSPTELFSSEKITNIQNSLQGQITTNDNDILALQNKTQKLNSSGDASAKINYASAQTFTNPLEIVSKDYVDSKTSNISNIELKVQYLDTNGRYTNDFEPSSTGAYPLGTNSLKWSQAFILDDVNCDRTILNKIWRTGGSQGVEFLSGAGVPVKFTGSDYSAGLDRGIITIDTSTVGEQGKLKKNSVASLSDAGDLKINGGELVKTTFTNDQELITKKYVDDANLGQGTDITTLQNKTQKLDLAGNFVATVTPNADNVYNMGANILRFNTVFGTNGSFSDKVNSNAFLNTGHNIGMNIDNTPAGQVSFNSNSLYADGNANRALIMDATGNLNKSGVVINTQNIECKDITCQKIVGNTGGPNDLVLENQAGVGIIIKDGATGNLCFDGSAYADNANVGKYLKIDDNKGLIVADTPAGGGSGDVVGPVNATDNAITRYDLTTGKLIQNSTVLLTDTGAINNVLSIEPTANENVSYGLGANNTGSTNISLGTNSGTGNTGSFNVMIGRGTKNNSGGENIIIGESAGSNALTGTQNICVGSGSGSNNLTSNNDCIFIGRGFNNIGTGGLNNMICLGNGITRRANEVVIGGTGSTTTTIRANADNHCDLGYFDNTTNAQFKNLYISGSIFLNGIEQQLVPKNPPTVQYLDTIASANIKIACGLTKLLTAYAGSCLRVRRASDNLETNIGFNLQGYIDRSTLSTFISGTSGFVVSWYDQSGQGNVLTSAIQAEQPEILLGTTTDSINDVRIKYNGSSHILSSLSDTNTMNLLGASTVSIRYSTADTATRGLLNNGSNTDTDFSIRYQNNNSVVGTHRAGVWNNAPFTALSDSKPHSIIMRVEAPISGNNAANTNLNRTVDRVGQNGGSLFNTVNGSAGISPIVIGKSWDAINNVTFWAGNINTFIVHDIQLSPAQADSISQNIF